MKALLVSTYDLGHQPLHVASPAAALRRAGHDVRCRDLSVQEWEESDVEWADGVAFSVPMHTAMRLALEAVNRIQRSRPDIPICLYGLYAHIDDGAGRGPAVDTVSGEYERGLLEWARSVSDGEPVASHGQVVDLGRQQFHAPIREGLPGLEHYSQLAIGGERRLAGYVEASHGCAHRCGHCPVPAVYDGKVRVVGEDVVLRDIANLASMGARHITFGDPDFLNAPRHSLRVVRSMHERFPELTFDCTTKVEHILRHESIWPEMADAGCLFVVSALECMNDEILARLDKGHTARDARRAVELLRLHGIEPRPSFLPFTPWSDFQDVFDILDFVGENDLVDNVDPIQYTIRLLVPHGSLLLRDPAFRALLGDFDAERLTYTWRSADRRLDDLQRRLLEIAERAAQTDAPLPETFTEMGEAVVDAADDASLAGSLEMVSVGVERNTPRLTEPWFC
ncbi:MAG: CUAEP/CCAEP-tail radical SAM protein [Chloroflexi bacterium]|nr:CUAEP/CCAEP-tail radical SAM protein [Chloroflexota bacterium]MCY3936836.1 CUAEP/CCAEP-tail radical SAM protein [Chloroflexota bacterium]